MTISSCTSSFSSRLRTAPQNSGASFAAITSTSATSSHSILPSLLQRPCPGERTKLVASEPVSQFLQETVEPFLGDRLPLSGLLRDEDLHEIGAVH